MYASNSSISSRPRATAFWREHSQLRLELLDDVLGGEIEVDLGRCEPVVAERTLQRGQGNALADHRDREGMPDHVGSSAPARVAA